MKGIYKHADTYVLSQLEYQVSFLMPKVSIIRLCFMTHKLLQIHKKHVSQVLNTIKELDCVNKNLPQCSI